MKNGLITIVTLLILSGCGGGSVPFMSATSSPIAQSTTGDLATTMPVPTYVAGSNELAMFTRLNEVRLKGGFGMLAQDIILDKAATNHAHYNINNYFTTPYTWSSAMGQIDPATGTLNAHVEHSGMPGFTGIKAGDRATAAGTKFAGTGEVISSVSDCLGSLLNTVFHRDGLLNTDYQKIGIAYVLTPENRSISCVMNPAFVTKAAVKPNGWLGIYPGDGQTGLKTEMGGESPDPAPDLAKRGAPVTVYLNSELSALPTFTLTAHGTNQQTAVRLLTNADFPKYIQKNVAHILPTEPLAYNTTYTANFIGLTIDGATVIKTWTFKTVSGMPTVITVSASTLTSGMPITATYTGGSGTWSNIYAYSSYRFSSGVDPKATFGDIVYNSPSSLSITRNMTPCNDGIVLNCVVVIVATDSTGAKTSTTIPVE